MNLRRYMSQYHLSIKNIAYWPRYFYWIAALLAFSMLQFVGYQMFLKSKYHTLEKAKSAFIKLNGQVTRDRKSAAQLPVEQQANLKAAQALSQFTNQFPATDLLVNITKLSQLMHLKLIVIEPLTQQETGEKNTLLHIILEGDFYRIKAFIENITELLPLATFTEFSLDALTESLTPPKMLRFDGRLLVYDLQK